MIKQENRFILYVVLLSIGFVNVALGVVMPAYFVYKAFLRQFGYVSRFEIMLWGAPALCFSMMIGFIVFIVCMLVYMKFHQRIDSAL